MKRVLLLALAAVSASQMGVAASCIGGTLSAYVALGAGGCTIGGDLLSNFKILSGTAGATPIAPTAVTVTPTGGSFNPGLMFSASQSASSGSLLELIFTYQISGLSYIGSSVALSGSAETGAGAVTGIQNYCAGGAFGPDGVTGCTGLGGSLLTLDGVQQTDGITFGRSAFINVTNDFTLDASGGGTARGGTFSNSFTAVPEPFSTALAGAGLALAALAGKRSLLAKLRN